MNFGPRKTQEWYLHAIFVAFFEFDIPFCFSMSPVHPAMLRPFLEERSQGNRKEGAFESPQLCPGKIHSQIISTTFQMRLFFNM